MAVSVLDLVKHAKRDYIAERLGMGDHTLDVGTATLEITVDTLGCGGVYWYTIDVREVASTDWHFDWDVDTLFIWLRSHPEAGRRRLPGGGFLTVVERNERPGTNQLAAMAKFTELFTRRVLANLDCPSSSLDTMEVE